MSPQNAAVLESRPKQILKLQLEIQHCRFLNLLIMGCLKLIIRILQFTELYNGDSNFFFLLVIDLRIAALALLFNMPSHRVVAVGLWSGFIQLLGRQYRGCGGSAPCADLLPAKEHVGHGRARSAEASAAISHLSASGWQCSRRPAPFHCLQVIMLIHVHTMCPSSLGEFD